MDPPPPPPRVPAPSPAPAEIPVTVDSAADNKNNATVETPSTVALPSSVVNNAAVADNSSVENNAAVANNSTAEDNTTGALFEASQASTVANNTTVSTPAASTVELFTTVEQNTPVEITATAAINTPVAPIATVVNNATVAATRTVRLRPIQRITDGLTPGQFSVYSLMFERGEARPQTTLRLFRGGYVDLVRLTGLSKRGIQNVIAELQAKSVISIHQAPGYHRSQTTVYEVPTEQMILDRWFTKGFRYAAGKSKNLVTIATVE